MDAKNLELEKVKAEKEQFMVQKKKRQELMSQRTINLGVYGYQCRLF